MSHGPVPSSESGHASMSADSNFLTVGDTKGQLMTPIVAPRIQWNPDGYIFTPYPGRSNGPPFNSVPDDRTSYGDSCTYGSAVSQRTSTICQ